MSDISFSEDFKRAVQIAQSIAREYGHANFSPAHLLKALLHKDLEMRSMLEGMGKDIFFMEEWAEVRIEQYPKSPKPVESPVGDDKVLAALEEADHIRLKLNKDQINCLCVLASLSTPGVGFTYEQLKTYPLLPGELLNASVEEASVNQAVFATKPGAPAAGKAGAGNALMKYTIDKTGLAREGKIDPIIGRDKETRMVAEVLGRRTKPNVIIVGEPGVGKTALVDGFALNIVNGKVPSNLANAVIFELDYGSLIAGAAYKGEVEDRLKSIIKEIKQFEKAILFIDEIHTLIDSKGGSAGAANLLKPELARGELTIIGATTNDEYRTYIEADEAFSRRFEVIRLDEPDENAATRMLQTLMPFYENHHGIKVEGDAVPEAVRLAKRYIKDRRLPDSAIDLIDRTMSVVKLMGETSKDEIISLKESLDAVINDANLIDEAALLAELKWYYSR
jgi:ATP-dependent Clp protease ATP-binding subunit ClpB